MAGKKSPQELKICHLKEIQLSVMMYGQEKMLLFFLVFIQVMELFIIGANSVVAKDIEPYAVAVGNPCHVVKKRFTEEKI